LKQSSSERTYSDEYQSPGNADEPTSNPYQRGFVGLLVVGVDAALLYLAVSLLYQTDKPSRFAIAAASLLVASVVIIHGLFYVCLGVWAFRAYTSL
jgi:hypothetical protein